MNKIPFKELKEELYKEEKEIFIDSLADFPQDEREEALEEFEEDWKSVEDLDQLVELLCQFGFEQEEAFQRIVDNVIDFN